MEAKDSLVKVLKALIEIKIPMEKQNVVAFLMGKDSAVAEEQHWDDMECFGIGDGHDEDYWSNVLEAAIKQAYLKYKPAKSTSIVPTPAGKKFAKKPTSFEISEEDESFGSDEVLGTGDFGIDEMVLMAMRDKNRQGGSSTSTKTRLQIKLIQAVDRKFALDDFAENEGLAFDEVLDEIEGMLAQGKKLDISYFTDEVLGDQCMDELLEYFGDAPSDDLDDAIREMGDVYNPEELRLARIVFRVNGMK